MKGPARGDYGPGIALTFGIFYAIFWLLRAVFRSDLFEG